MAAARSEPKTLGERRVVIGKNDRFTKAVVRFGKLYADQAAEDYEAFTDALNSGRLASEIPADSPIQA